jgi:hypothetical protein
MENGLNFATEEDTIELMPEHQAPKKDSSKPVIVVLVLLGVICLIAAIVYYVSFNSTKKSGDSLSENEAANVIEQVGKLMVLPTGEEPTVAAVVDTYALQDQPFFNNAKVGDVVLIYAGARKAILFDSQNNRIIEVQPVVFGDPPAVNP